MRLSPLSPSFETAIAYQGESALFKELTAAMADFRVTSMVNGQSEATRKVDAIIFKHTGLKINLTLINAPVINAYMMVPAIDVNSVMVDNYDRDNPDWADYVKMQQKRIGLTNEIRRAEVDLMNSRVSGFFSEISCEMGLFTGVFYDVFGGKTLDDDEIAAILLHEIGHAFTWLEALTMTVSMNLALDQCWREMANRTDPVQRLEVGLVAAKAMGIDEENAQALAKSKSKDEFSIVLIKSTIDKLRSSMGSHVYDYRMSEFSADRFAARHGAGLALVRALDKLDRLMGGSLQRHRVGPILFVLGEFLKIAFNIVSTVGLIIPIVLLGWLGVHDSEYKIYDDPGERLTRIRNELVAALKNTRLPKAELKRLHDDVVAIDKIRMKITDRRSFYEWVWVNLTPSRRAQKNKMQFQQELERLVNNDLYIKANQLNILD